MAEEVPRDKLKWVVNCKVYTRRARKTTPNPTPDPDPNPVIDPDPNSDVGVNNREEVYGVVENSNYVEKGGEKDVEKALSLSIGLGEESNLVKAQLNSPRLETVLVDSSSLSRREAAVCDGIVENNNDIDVDKVGEKDDEEDETVLPSKGMDEGGNLEEPQLKSPRLETVSVDLSSLSRLEGAACDGIVENNNDNDVDEVGEKDDEGEMVLPSKGMDEEGNLEEPQLNLPRLETGSVDSLSLSCPDAAGSIGVVENNDDVDKVCEKEDKEDETVLPSEGMDEEGNLEEPQLKSPRLETVSVDSSSLSPPEVAVSNGAVENNDVDKGGEKEDETVLPSERMDEEGNLEEPRSNTPRLETVSVDSSNLSQPEAAISNGVVENNNDVQKVGEEDDEKSASKGLGDEGNLVEPRLNSPRLETVSVDSSSRPEATISIGVVENNNDVEKVGEEDEKASASKGLGEEGNLVEPRLNSPRLETVSVDSSSLSRPEAAISNGVVEINNDLEKVGEEDDEKVSKGLGEEGNLVEPQLNSPRLETVSVDSSSLSRPEATVSNGVVENDNDAEKVGEEDKEKLLPSKGMDEEGNLAEPQLNSPRLETISIDSSSLSRPEAAVSNGVGDEGVGRCEGEGDESVANGLGRLIVKRVNDRVSISVSNSSSKPEVRELKRKLVDELDQIRKMAKRLEVKEVQLSGYSNSGFDTGFSRPVGPNFPYSVNGVDNMRPSRQLMVSVMDTNHGIGEAFEKEKRTPKANQFYRNSEFLLGKEKLPPTEGNKKSKSSSGKKHKGSRELDYGIGIDKQLLKHCSGLLHKLISHKHGWIFKEPVDVNKLGLHDYFDIIKHPMDLGTVKSRLSNNWYKTPREFAEDVRLTFHNAMRYNPEGQDVHVIAKDLLRVFEDKWMSIETEYERKLRYDMIHNIGMPTPTSRKAFAPSNLPSPRSFAPPPLLHEPPPSLKRSQSMPVPPESRSKPLTYVPRTPALKKPKAKDPNKRDMTFDEKQKLSTNLQSLPTDKLDAIVQIIKKRNSALSQHDDEIEVDIDSVDTETLWELDRFVTNYRKNLSKRKRKAEIALERAAALAQAANVAQLVPETIQVPTSVEPTTENRQEQGNGPTPQAQRERRSENVSDSSSSSSSSSSDSGSSSSDSNSDSSSDSDSDRGQ